jgi:hypothetical protein
MADLRDSYLDQWGIESISSFGPIVFEERDSIL